LNFPHTKPESYYILNRAVRLQHGSIIFSAYQQRDANYSKLIVAITAGCISYGTDRQAAVTEI
jgi:hypothetical protein